jgi:hypothetical protein
MKKIVITAGSVSLPAELNESATAKQIWKALPIEEKASRWGDEIYFEIPVVVEQEPDAEADVEVGTLAYWPVGHAFCIFFGKTPASRGEKPRAYSPVNLVGRVTGDATLFKKVRDGAKVKVEASR